MSEPKRFTSADRALVESDIIAVLTLGLDIGSKLGYHYPTADMLYPDRFANLKGGPADDDEGADEEAVGGD